MGINWFAGVWGVAEATVFFIVPDVLLSIAGRQKLRNGLIACVYSLIGALIGGLIMFFWGVLNLEAANSFLTKIPAISPVMIENVNTQLNEQGLMAVLFGPLGGTPYKTYAVQAGGQGMSLWLFMLISIPARFVRFVLVTIFFHYALKAINLAVSSDHNLKLLMFGWVVFYSFYFWVMGF